MKSIYCLLAAAIISFPGLALTEEGPGCMPPNIIDYTTYDDLLVTISAIPTKPNQLYFDIKGAMVDNGTAAFNTPDGWPYNIEQAVLNIEPGKTATDDDYSFNGIALFCWQVDPAGGNTNCDPYNNLDKSMVAVITGTSEWLDANRRKWTFVVDTAGNPMGGGGTSYGIEYINVTYNGTDGNMEYPVNPTPSGFTFVYTNDSSVMTVTTGTFN